MLVLTRKQGEEILIGHDIQITVTAIVGDKVRIGISAPPEVRVDRREVRLRIALETQTLADQTGWPTVPGGV